MLHVDARFASGDMRPVLKNYTDHSANERTFMAWLRTAISVMAFGFIVEKFDLFLSIAGLSIAGGEIVQSGQMPARTSHVLGDVTGLALVLMGAAMIVGAAYRYWSTAKDIDSPEARPVQGPRAYLLLAALLLLASGALFAHLVRAIPATH